MKNHSENVEKLFSDYLEQRQLKYTPERRRILREVLSLHFHFEADELYFALREKGGHRISRATVYRTLPLLEESGLIRRVIFIDKHTHYEQVYGHKHHEHLICLSCGAVIDFYNQSLEKTLDEVSQKNAFTPVAHKLEITGYCKECSKQNR